MAHVNGARRPVLPSPGAAVTGGAATMTVPASAGVPGVPLTTTHARSHGRCRSKNASSAAIQSCQNAVASSQSPLTP